VPPVLIATTVALWISCGWWVNEDMHIVVWVVEGTWQVASMLRCRTSPPIRDSTLLHVTPSDVTEAADAASIGLFGRGFPGRQTQPAFDDIADDEASSLLARRQRASATPMSRGSAGRAGRA